MKQKCIIKLYVWVDVYLLNLCNVYIRGIDTSVKREAINSADLVYVIYSDGLKKDNLVICSNQNTNKARTQHVVKLVGSLLIHSDSYSIYV